MINYEEIKYVPQHDWTGTYEELLEALTNKDTVLGANICFEVDSSLAASILPETALHLPHALKPTMEDKEFPLIVLNDDGEYIESTEIRSVQSIDEEGKLIFEPKTWDEFAIIYRSVTEGKILIRVVNYITESKCHNSPSSDLVHLYSDIFGKENVRTKSTW